MNPYITDVRYLHDYVLWLRFSDGVEGEVDLAGELYGQVFEPLRVVEAFRRVRLDPELDTVVWDNGADMAPDFLYEISTPVDEPFLQKAAEQKEAYGNRRSP